MRKNGLIALLALLLALTLTPALAEEAVPLDLVAAEAVSAPVDPAVGEADGTDLWAEPDGNAAEAPDEQATQNATTLGEAWTEEQFNAWYEAQKTSAKAADHVLGEGGDLFSSYQTLVLPGETIAVVPVNAGISDSGMVKYGLLSFSFDIYQLSNPEVSTDYYGTNLLPRTGTPSKTTLREVETATFRIPYLARQGINDVEEGSISEITYVSLYVNDTGLPMLIQGRKDDFKENKSAGKMIGYGGKDSGGASFQGYGTIYSRPKFWFIENYYTVDLDKATFEQYYEKSAEAMVLDDGMTSWLKAKSPFPIKMYIDGEDHTYEIPNPLMKGYGFWGWNDAGNSWHWGELPSRSYPLMEIEAPNFRYEFTNEKTVLRINARDFIRQRGKHDSGLSYLCDSVLYPSFSSPRYFVSQDTMSLGFNPQGGKVNGQDYYLCNAPGLGDHDREFGVDIGKIVPVREGCKFKGWCTDPKKPDATLIKNTSIAASTSWRKEGHVELYAVWDGAQAAKTSIAKAKITVKDQAYTGKAIAPAPTVKLGKKKLKAGTDYTVKYTNNKKVGTATVKVIGTGSYTGTATATFKINPKAVALTKLTPDAGKLTATWKKASGVTGYELQYALKKSFAGKKTVTVAKAKAKTLTVTGLKSNKTYYVRVRAYKTIKGVKYASAWSNALSVKVK